MWKLLFGLFVIAVSASSIDGKGGLHCQENFHKVCGASDVIGIVKQVKCNSTTLCDGKTDEDYCRVNCQGTVTLNIDDFSSIQGATFRSNFTTIRLISESNNCERKMIELTPRSWIKGVTVEVLELDCIEFPLKANPFEKLRTLKKLSMSRMEWTEGPGSILSNFPELSQLELSQINITAITPNSFSDKKNLQVLKLKSNNLSVIEGKSFEQLNILRSLHITDNQLTDLEPEMFYGLKNLEFLFLSNNKITVIRNNTFSILPKLQYLRLRGNEISQIELGAFSGLHLRLIDLRSNRLETWPIGVFGNFKDLRTLILAENNISTLSRGMFEGVRGKNLFIDLAENTIHHIEPNTFLGIQLYRLSLASNNLTVLEPDTFNGLRCLDFLNLISNGISEIKEQAFRNSTMPKILFSGNNMTTLGRASWGLDDSVSIIE